MAREVHSGRKAEKYPRSGFYNDLDAVACYAPFCDAMFVDKDVSHLSRQGELRMELGDQVRLFSLREKDEFLFLLEKIEADADTDHLSKVREVYGKDWEEPYRDLVRNQAKRLEGLQ